MDTINVFNTLQHWSTRNFNRLKILRKKCREGREL